MSFVLDASATAPWFFESEFDEESVALASRLIDQGATAPAIWPLEVFNIFGSGIRKRRIDRQTAVAFGKRLWQLQVEVEPIEKPFVEKAFAIALRHSISLYDATYIELAHRRHLPLATRDERLKSVARSLKIKLT